MHKINLFFIVISLILFGAFWGILGGTIGGQSSMGLGDFVGAGNCSFGAAMSKMG